MFSTSTYTERRHLLKKQVAQGLILLPGNDASSMNYRDNHYPFRQDSCFLYFSGIDQPGLVLLIDIDNDTETLFGEEASIDDIIWTGPQEPLQQKAALAGIGQVKPCAVLEAMLQQAVAAKHPIHFLPPYRAAAAQQLSEWLSIPYRQVERQASLVLIRAIVAQRSVKSAEEMVQIEEAVNITAAMQLEAIRNTRPGISEIQLEGLLPGIAAGRGGQLCFPPIVTTNGQFLHNHATQQVLQPGQLLLCDLGAENSMHYAGDLTRTIPVSGSFSSRQREVYDIVLNASRFAAGALQPGVLFRDVHLLACTRLVEGLQALELMQGEVQEAVAAGAHTLFFQCGLGHMMGLDVHDMENLGEAEVGYTEELKKSTDFGIKSLRLGRALEAGFVLTIEPGIYFIPQLIEQWQAAGKYKQFIRYDRLAAYLDFGGIRIEDNYLVTPEGSRLLGDPLPQTASGIEQLMKTGGL